MHGSRTERADYDIRELNRQIRSSRMEIYRTNQGCATSWRDQAWLQAELEIQERAHQETRIRTLQEVEESKKDLLS